MKVLHVFTISATAKSFFDGQFAYLSKKGHELHLVASPDEIAEFCNKNSVKFHPIDIARRIDITTDIQSIRSLYFLIKAERFDAVFGHTPKGAMVAMIASFLARVPIRVYLRHGVIYTTASGIKRFILKSVERITAFLANRIINVSPSLSELAVKGHLNTAKKQTVIGRGTCGGIDALETFNPQNLSSDLRTFRKRLGIDESDFVIGFCGRLCNDKGIRELIAAYDLFKAQHPGITTKLLLVGAMDARDVLPDNVKSKIKSDSNIIATGLQPRENLPDYYKTMDVFVFPSYREGFGMCVIEASAMEVPILVSRSHGCIDSIEEGVTGEYIDLDPSNICKMLDGMLDSNKRITYGKNGRNFVLTNFDQSILWPKIADYYDSLAQKI